MVLTAFSDSQPFRSLLLGQIRVARLGFLLVASLSSTFVHAAPSIQAVEGNLLPGSEVKIIGKSFSVAPQRFNLKDNSDIYSLLTFGANFSVAGPEDLWMTKGSSWATPLLPVPGRNGYVYQGKGKTYNQYIRPLDTQTNDTLYVSWLYKPSESPGHSGGSNKFIRIWDNHNGEDTRISWTGMHMTYSGYTKASWAGWSGQVNNWNRMELWVDGPSGRIEAKINGKVVHDVDDFVKVPNGIGLNVKLLGFDPSSATPYANMVTQIDDLYASTTPARVVLSDQPKWSDALVEGEALIPSSWTDSEVVLNLNLDDQMLSHKAYVYVVDKDGVANAEGYEICGVCPKPPQLTSN